MYDDSDQIMKKSYSLALFLVMFLATVTVFLGINSVMAEEGKIPTWVKGVFGYYVQGHMEDSELIDALEFLIDEGIIDIENKQYQPFSKTKFSSTGGFNPAWLEGEKELILETCAEARSMGYENSYCQYVQ